MSRTKKRPRKRLLVDPRDLPPAPPEPDPGHAEAERDKWWKTFERLCSLPPVITNEDVAWTMGVSVDTCERRIRDHEDLTFAEFRDKRQGVFRTRLLAKQYQIAMRGNPTLLIWLGKNYLEQKDTGIPVRPPSDESSRLILDLSGKSFNVSQGGKNAEAPQITVSADQSGRDPEGVHEEPSVPGLSAPKGSVQ